MSDAAPVAIRPAVAPDDMEDVRALFLEYGRSLDFSLCFQGFDAELANLPGCYAAPMGEILLAVAPNGPGGVVALRPLEAGICEMKRLYVRPGLRGRAVGAGLARAIVAAGRRRGYRTMRLDTHESMIAAMALYRGLGFREIPAYYANPLHGIRYFELDLAT